MELYNAHAAWFQNSGSAQQDRHAHANVAQNGAAEHGVHNGGGWKDGGLQGESGSGGGAAPTLEPIDFGLDDLPREFLLSRVHRVSLLLPSHLHAAPKH
jgi:hypothetical protein